MKLRDFVPPIALPIAVYKIVLLLAVVAVPVLMPRLFSVGNYAANFHGPAEAAPTLASHFSTWDGEHFVALAEHGYIAGSESNRHFPLWPWTIRAGAMLLGGHYLLAAVLLSNLFSFVALLLFHRIVRETEDEATADLSVYLWLAYPGALFFSMPYSESLFCLFAVGWYFCIRKNRLLGAAVLAALLPLVRVVGLLIVVPIFVDVVSRWQKTRKLSWQSLISLAAPFVGFGLYLLFMQVAVGNAWDAFDVHRQNTVLSGDARRALHPVAFLHNFLNATDLHAPLTSVIDRMWFVLLVPMLLLLWRRSRVECAYAFVIGLVPAVTNAFFGLTRYFLPLFPVIITLAIALRAPARRHWLALVLALWFGLQMFFFARHTSFHWVG